MNEYQQLAERTARKANDTPEKRFTTSLRTNRRDREVRLPKNTFSRAPADRESPKLSLGDVMVCAT